MIMTVMMLQPYLAIQTVTPTMKAGGLKLNLQEAEFGEEEMLWLLKMVVETHSRKWPRLSRRIEIVKD